MGPLAGIRIIEMAGIGPAPFCATLFADMGAEVIRIDRREKTDLGLPGKEPKFDVLHRGRKSVSVDVRTPAGRDVVRRLAKSADALIEGFRPGVMERLGLGPDILAELNPRLVFGRMTGYGQDGPMASVAGHDINYIGLSGALHAVGKTGTGPIPPLNLVGDFGGGGMFLAFGVVAALLEAKRSGKGQVVDVSMVEGSAYLMAAIYGFYAQGGWSDERGTNVLDGGVPYYDTYRTKDDRWVGIGAIEGRFFKELITRLGLQGEGLVQHDRAGWPRMRERFAAVFASKTRAEWETIFEGSDACFAPVLTMGEAANHPPNAARKSFVAPNGVVQPAPAPRFSRTAPEIGKAPSELGADTDDVLDAWGFSREEVTGLREKGVVGPV
jgi:alpha-methylacyl-CoA racemase